MLYYFNWYIEGGWNMKHIFKKDNQYLMFNSEDLSLYRIPERFNSQLDKGEEIDFSVKDHSEKVTITNINLKKCSRLILVISKLCNLDCKYCYASGGSYGNSEHKLMDLEMLKKSIEAVVDLFPEGIDNIQFFGGEPLVNIDIIEDAIQYIISYMKEKNLSKPNFTIVTNGTLIDKRARDLFNKYFQSVTVSLDGNKHFNDLNRVFKNKKDSVYDIVVDKIKFLNEDRKFLLDIEMTADDNQVRFYDRTKSIENFKSIEALNVDSIHIAPEISNVKDETLNKSRVNYFEECCKESLHGDAKEINLVKAKSTIEILRRRQKSLNFCSAGITNICIDEKGDIYPCFMFLEKQEFIMGNVEQLDKELFENKRKIYLNNKTTTNPKCRNCWANTICAEACSGCIGSFYLTNKDISKVVDIDCEIGKAILERVLYEIYKYSEK